MFVCTFESSVSIAQQHADIRCAYVRCGRHGCRSCEQCCEWNFNSGIFVLVSNFYRFIVSIFNSRTVRKRSWRRSRRNAWPSLTSRRNWCGRSILPRAFRTTKRWIFWKYKNIIKLNAIVCLVQCFVKCMVIKFGFAKETGEMDERMIIDMFESEKVLKDLKIVSN